ncbi:AAA family ATPase, partial [candidate division KSB1 bacterium]|nr:AAA family ATPase [candidate division KSB1 bacterium]
KVTRKKINTKNILFVMSGAFAGLADIIRRRMNQQPIGFRSNLERDALSRVEEFQLLKKVRSEDLLKYGFESEFIGRLPVVVTLNDLDIDGLYRILKNPKSSVILGKKRDFASYNITVDFSDGALKRIAEMAYEEKTGARGLVSVTDRVLIKFEKKLPDTQITQFTVTSQVVDNPDEELQKLLVNYYIKNFQRRFLASNGIIITFAENAIPLILEKSAAEGKNFEAYCNDLLRDYEYGLRLLSCEEFTVTKELVQEPKNTLEKLIKESYERHS